MDTEAREKKTKLRRRGHVDVASVMGNAPPAGVWTRRCCLSSGPCLRPPDQPEDGPQLYVLLFGFHQPLLVAALDAVGVHVSSVIRLCSEDPEREERCQGDGQPAGEPCAR